MRIHIIIAMCLVCCSCMAGPKEYTAKKVAEYPHDVNAYTQGLFFNGSVFYESTGQWGKSSFRIVDLKSGKVLRKLDFNRKYFGEGSVILGDTMYMLTWQNKVIFTYDAATLEYRQTYSYQREGWGITTDGALLYLSDGSSNLYVMDADLKQQRVVKVTFDGRPLRFLNELEWIDGKIWANVYTTDMIVIINPETGVVEGRIDCSGLLPDKLRTADTDVLNGIAYDPESGKIYITGKNWPRLYEITIK